jgi:glycosyltransferase involved in cell wall biosynthesis
MRIFQIMAGSENGGAEAFFTRLVPALGRAGVEQCVAIRRNAKRAKILSEAGVEPFELPFGGPLDLYTPFRLRREIKVFKPDIVLTWMNRATIMCPPGEFVHVGRLGGYYDLKYYQGCDHLIGNTEDIVGHLIANDWPVDKAHYLPNFVSAARAEPASRAASFTPRGALLVLALGRLHQNKAFDVLFKAMARVPDAYLWLAGDGPLRRELEDLAQKLGIKPRVRFLGWRDDVAALLSACDVFACSSRLEPLGNVVIEAWAQKILVVATDSLGPGTLIKHMETGVLVPVDDAAAFGRALKLVLEDTDLRQRMACDGHEGYQAKFTESVVVPQYLDFFKRITA